MDNLETQETLSTRDRTCGRMDNLETQETLRQEIERGRMDNLETQETLRDRTWKNRQSRDTGNIKR